eukprot:16375932-Heterocapsa_arctica.AAC.1
MATDPTFSSVAVIRMPDNMAWMPAVQEPPRPMASGKGKSRAPGKHDGESQATRLWPKTTKAAAQQGQMVILCCVDQAGEQFFWTGYMADVHGNTAIQIAATDIPAHLRGGHVGKHELT